MEAFDDELQYTKQYVVAGGSMINFDNPNEKSTICVEATTSDVFLVVRGLFENQFRTIEVQACDASET